MHSPRSRHRHWWRRTIGCKSLKGGYGRILFRRHNRRRSPFISAHRPSIRNRRQISQYIRREVGIGTTSRIQEIFCHGLHDGFNLFHSIFAFRIRILYVSRVLFLVANFQGEGSRLIASGDLNVGLLINVLFAVLVGSFSLAQLMPRIQSFISATSAAQKVFQTIHRIPSIDSLDDGGLRPDLRGDIHFTDVSFIYPSRPQGAHLIYQKLIESHGAQERLVCYPRGKVYRYCWSLWIWKIDHHSFTRTFL